MIYRAVLYPRLFSPLRSIPGPPLGGLLLGQFKAILDGEVGIPQRQWLKKYGPVVRVVGPVGIERLIFLNPSALHKILVRDYLDYPLVKVFCRARISFSNHTSSLFIAPFHERCVWFDNRIWTFEPRRTRTQTNAQSDEPSLFHPKYYASYV